MAASSAALEVSSASSRARAARRSREASASSEREAFFAARVCAKNASDVVEISAREWLIGRWATTKTNTRQQQLPQQVTPPTARSAAPMVSRAISNSSSSSGGNEDRSGGFLLPSALNPNTNMTSFSRINHRPCQVMPCHVMQQQQQQQRQKEGEFLLPPARSTPAPTAPPASTPPGASENKPRRQLASPRTALSALRKPWRTSAATPASERPSPPRGPADIDNGMGKHIDIGKLY